MHSHAVAVEKKQSLVSLTAIQVTGATSIPVLNASIQLLHQNGFWRALGILLVGNILVWCIAMLIVRMIGNKKKNTLENAKDYLGHWGVYPLALVLIVSTIASFVLQINLATEIILQIVNLHYSVHVNSFMQVGVVLGVLSTFVCMEGIKGLRWIALISFPILILSFLGVLVFAGGESVVALQAKTTIGSLAIAFGTSLGVAVDYPTFFQHSKSKRDSFYAVTSIQALTFLIGVGGLLLGRHIGSTQDVTEWQMIFDADVWIRALFLLLVVLSCLCVNSVNIYSASIGWELLAPDALTGRKEYLILGLGLTSIFILLTNLVPVYLFLTITDVTLATLCLVLVTAYLGKLWLRVRVAEWEKMAYFAVWTLGTILAIWGGVQDPIGLVMLVSGILISVVGSALIFGVKRLTAC